MPVLCDINWLLALCHESHVHHLQAKMWLEERDDQMVICRITQLGLLRLLTNPAVMQSRAFTTNEAWKVFDIIMSDFRFSFGEEPSGLPAKLREFTRGFPFSPKLWQDAYLAAFAVSAKMSLVTFDAGFRKFKELDCQILSEK